MPKIGLRLRYRLESRNQYDTVDPAAVWRGRLGDADAELHLHRLSAVFEDSTMGPATARTRLDPLLRDWEGLAFLADRSDIHFRYEGCGPSDAESPDVELDATGAELALLPDVNAIVRRQRTDYLPPDPSFHLSDEVREMIDAIVAFRADASSLPEAAGNVLRILIRSSADGKDTIDGGSLLAVAERLDVDEAILETLSELTTRTPAPDAPPGRSLYRGPEWRWMQEAMMALALQAGRSGAGPAASRLTMEGDLAAP